VEGPGGMPGAHCEGSIQTPLSEPMQFVFTFPQIVISERALIISGSKMEFSEYQPGEYIIDTPFDMVHDRLDLLRTKKEIP
jgi:hypothetical protein